MAIVAFFIWAAVQANGPSDEEMIRHFEKNKARFEALVNGPTGLAEAELADLGIEGFQAYRSSEQDATYDLTTWSWGIVGTSDVKGYYYSTKDVSPLVSDADDHAELTYHALGGGWHIYHEVY